MKSHTYPRVVILSMTDISSSTATGSLLRELFAGFPPDRVFQICAAPATDPVAEKYLNKSFLHPNASRLSGLRRLTPIRLLLRFFGNPQSDILEEVSRFKPDLIYIRVVDDLYRYLELANLISRQFRIPVVSHVMDDYETPMAFSDNCFERVVKKNLLRRELKRLFRNARANFAISEAMCSAFHERYSAKFECFHNGIDPDQWKSVVNDPRERQAGYDNQPLFKMVMAGSIDERKDAQVIGQISRAVATLNDAGEFDFRLVLNVPGFHLAAARRLADQFEGVTAQEYSPVEEYRRLLQHADCLVLARNSDPISRAYTEFSFHNKLPEYMISGTPILCIGPQWDGSVRLLTSQNAGVVLRDPNGLQIRETLMEMARHPDEYGKFAVQARAYASANFDINRIRKRFEQRLSEAALEPRAAP